MDWRCLAGGFMVQYQPGQQKSSREKVYSKNVDATANSQMETLVAQGQ